MSPEEHYRKATVGIGADDSVVALTLYQGRERIALEMSGLEAVQLAQRLLAEGTILLSRRR